MCLFSFTFSVFSPFHICCAITPHHQLQQHQIATNERNNIEIKNKNKQVLTPSSGFLDFAISMRPDYHQAIIDTIRFYGWKKIIYLYDSHDGEYDLRLCLVSGYIVDCVLCTRPPHSYHRWGRLWAQWNEQRRAKCFWKFKRFIWPSRHIKEELIETEEEWKLRPIRMNAW